MESKVMYLDVDKNLIWHDIRQGIQSTGKCPTDWQRADIGFVDMSLYSFLLHRVFRNA